ncbi:MAG: trigger factor family protein [Cytophagales bacterium]|nr:MAG: trigger factor family protein [Cytophagales bacterium]TAF62267.1 MAG: trigger factor family protein [Cytophagales bacterium]
MSTLFKLLKYKTLETNFVAKDNQTATWTISLKESDYAPAVTKKTEEYRKKVNINGFRPGKAPLPLVKKMLGMSVYVDVVDNIISKELNEFIKAQPKGYFLNNNPVLVKKNSRMEFSSKDGVHYEFMFALRPEIKIDKSVFTRVKDYEPVIDKRIIEAQYEQNLAFSYDSTPSENPVNSASLVRGVVKIAEPYNHSAQVAFYMPTLSEPEQKPLLDLKIGESCELDVPTYFGDGDLLEYKLRIPRNFYAQGAPKSCTFEVSAILNVVVPESIKDILINNYGEGVSTRDAAIENITQESLKYIKQDIDFVVAEDLFEVLKEVVDVDISEEYSQLHLEQVAEAQETNMKAEIFKFKRGVKEGLVKNAVAEMLDIVLDDATYQLHLAKMLAVNMGFPPEFITDANYQQFLPYLTQELSNRNKELLEIITYRARLEATNTLVLSKLRSEGLLGATLPYSFKVRNEIFAIREKRREAEEAALAELSEAVQQD